MLAPDRVATLPNVHPLKSIPFSFAEFLEICNFVQIFRGVLRGEGECTEFFNGLLEIFSMKCI